MGGPLSEWRAVEGWRIETVTFDWLHNVYLGVARDVIASGIWLFIRQGMYDDWNLDCMDDLLGNLHMDIVATCKQYGFPGKTKIFLSLGGDVIFHHLSALNHQMAHAQLDWPASVCAWIRLSLPSKPVMSVANLGGKNDYPELGSRFKGCHVKTLLFWIALQSQIFADAHPTDS